MLQRHISQRWVAFKHKWHWCCPAGVERRGENVFLLFYAGDGVVSLGTRERNPAESYCYKLEEMDGDHHCGFYVQLNLAKFAKERFTRALHTCVQAI